MNKFFKKIYDDIVCYEKDFIEMKKAFWMKLPEFHNEKVFSWVCSTH